MKHIRKLLLLSITALIAVTAANAQETFVSGGYTSVRVEESNIEANFATAYAAFGVETPVLSTNVTLLPQVKFLKGMTSDNVLGYEVDINHAITLEMPIAYNWDFGHVYLGPALTWVVEDGVNGTKLEDGPRFGIVIGCSINVTENSYVTLGFNFHENLQMTHVGFTWRF